jgi:hypothetical protein
MPRDAAARVRRRHASKAQRLSKAEAIGSSLVGDADRLRLLLMAETIAIGEIVTLTPLP